MMAFLSELVDERLTVGPSLSECACMAYAFFKS